MPMQRPANRRREDSSSSPPYAQPGKIFYYTRVREADILSNPSIHLELRNRSSYQVGPVQGKEIEKSENICSSDKSSIEIPNDKNNIFFKLPVFYLDI